MTDAKSTLDVLDRLLRRGYELHVEHEAAYEAALSTIYSAEPDGVLRDVMPERDATYAAWYKQVEETLESVSQRHLTQFIYPKGPTDFSPEFEQEITTNFKTYIERLARIIADLERTSKAPGKLPSIRGLSTRAPRQSEFDETAEVDFQVGDLAAYSDSTIRFKGEVMEMTSQIAELCRLFISRPNQLINFDEIKEVIIEADKIGITKNATIAKYVSKLHGILRPYYDGNKVLYNRPESGWYFKPNS